MAEYPLQELDGIRYPKRRPFLVLLVVAGVTGFLLWLVMRKPAEEVPAPGEAEPVPSVSEAVVPAPAPTVAPSPPAPRGGRGTASSPPTPVLPVPAAPPATAPAAVAVLVQQARQAEAQAPQRADALATARRLYLDALAQAMDAATRRDVEARLGRVNVALAFSRIPVPGVKTPYVVQKGDSIARIAKKHGMTTALVQRGNGVANPNRIRAGDSYLLLAGKWSLHSSKGRYDLEVRFNDTFFKRYAVGIGKEGKTPVGTFAVTDRIAEPVWWKPDGKEVPYGHPENILGTRWLAIRATGDTPDLRGYGIHGTWDDSSIGKAESAGCLRMRNADVEELFDLIPLGTPVTITE